MRQILLGPIDRIEGVLMPDMPTDSNGGFHLFHFLVHGGVGFAKAVGPEHFPGQHFRVAQHQAPYGNVVAVHRAAALPSLLNEFAERAKTFARAFRVDAAGLRFALAKLAKAGDG
jgi:hypothetical protein